MKKEKEKMPAKSEAQRRLFGIALGMKRGTTPKTPGTAAAKIAEGLSESKIREYAKKSLSERIDDFIKSKEISNVH